MMNERDKLPHPDQPVALAPSVWSKYVPLEEGCYWFYGWLFGKDRAPGASGKPRMELVQVRLGGQGESRHLVYIGASAFIYPGRAFIGPVGVWMRAAVPDPPSDEEWNTIAAESGTKGEK